MDEIWRQVSGHPHYFVSSIGRVKSVDRLVNCRGGQRLVRGRMLRLTKFTHGYYVVMLNGRRKQSVHRLVALAFLGDPPPKYVVNHMDGNKLNNNVENLEWVTYGGNNLHAFRVLGRPGTSTGKFGEAHVTSRAVISINPKTGERIRYGSGMDAVRVGYDSGCITRACQGKSRHHKGLQWRYEDSQ